MVWGVTNEQYLEVGSRTVMEGDPSWAGPLAGEALGLKVFHVLEPEIKDHIPPDVYAEELMLLELAVGDLLPFVRREIDPANPVMTRDVTHAGRGDAVELHGAPLHTAHVADLLEQAIVAMCTDGRIGWLLLRDGACSIYEVRPRVCRAGTRSVPTGNSRRAAKPSCGRASARNGRAARCTSMR